MSRCHCPCPADKPLSIALALRMTRCQRPVRCPGIVLRCRVFWGCTSLCGRALGPRLSASSFLSLRAPRAHEAFEPFPSIRPEGRLFLGPILELSCQVVDEAKPYPERLPSRTRYACSWCLCLAPRSHGFDAAHNRSLASKPHPHEQSKHLEQENV